MDTQSTSVESRQSAPQVMRTLVPPRAHGPVNRVPHQLTLGSSNAGMGETQAPTRVENKAGHHILHGRSDARKTPDLDCMSMHREDAQAAAEKLEHDDVHHFEGQPVDQRTRAANILRDPNSPADAKLNALDQSEALPHGGYLRGDL